MALSRVRAGPLRGKVDQLRQNRLRWATTQQGAAAQQEGGDSGDEAAEARHGSGSASSSDTEGSNRSRALLRQQRRLKRQYQQPLPAPDGSLPLPLVPGVPWEAMHRAAAGWAGSDTQPPRCGACPVCLQIEQAAQDHDGSLPTSATRQQPQQPRCATAAALVAWDRQLGPVTAAAVRSLAALPAAQQSKARCGCCRQCCHQVLGKQLPCTAAKKLAAGKLPQRLQEVADQAAADGAAEIEQQEQPPQEPGVQSAITATYSGTALNGHSPSGASFGGGSSKQAGTGSGAPASRRAVQQRRASRLGKVDVVDLKGNRRAFLDQPLSTSSSDPSSSSSAGGGAAGEGEHSSACSSSSSSSSSDSEADAAWLPWVRSFLPRSHLKQRRRQQPQRGLGAGSANGSSCSDSEASGDDQLSRARLLLRRQCERDLRRGRMELPAYQVMEGWQAALQVPATELKRTRYKEAALLQRQLMTASAYCLAADMRLSLTQVSDWTCIAPSATGQGECGHRHAIRKPAWHLWRCMACGAPRWEGPGWQLHQRLAAALQAGAALEDALCPPHGSDAPMAAAVAAAEAALARFRWEAAGAGATTTAPPDAVARRSGSGSSSAGGSDSSSSDAETAAVALAAAGLPSFERGDEFRSLAEAVARMLAESRREAALRVEEGPLEPVDRRRCRDMRRSGLGRAAIGLERAAVRLVEEQRALERLRRRRMQAGPPGEAPPGWQAAAQAMPRQLAGFLPPAWQSAVVSGAQGIVPQQQEQQQEQQHGPQEERHHLRQQGNGEYADFLAAAVQLLQDCGLAAEPASGREDQVPEQQRQQERHLLHLLDALFFEPGGPAGTSNGGASSHAWDPAALASLKEQLLQHLPPGGAQPGPLGHWAAAKARIFAAEAGGTEQFEQQSDLMDVDRPASEVQQQHQQLQRPASLSAFQLLLQQAGQPPRSPEQQLSGVDPTLLQQQPSPSAFLSQADDNMAASPLGAPASQQAEAGQGAAEGALPGAFLLGTEASQPDPMQQAVLQPQQELQREVLERREQQRERRRQQQEQARQAQHAVAAAAVAGAAAVPEQQGPQGELVDPVCGRQLAAASDATFQFLWRLLEELLKRILQLQQHELDSRRYRMPAFAAHLQSKQAHVKLRLPPPLRHLAAATGDWQQDVQAAEHEQRQMVERLQIALAATPIGVPGAPAAAGVPSPAGSLPALAGQPDAGWIAWRADEAAAVSGSQDAAVCLRAPVQPTQQQVGRLGSAGRFRAAVACQPQRGLPLCTLKALLPDGALAAATLPLPRMQPLDQRLRNAGQQGKAAARPAAAGITPAPAPAARTNNRGKVAAQTQADFGDQLRLVTAHPQLLLLLEQPRLARCGSCAFCQGSQVAGRGRGTVCAVWKKCADRFYFQHQRKVKQHAQRQAQQLQRGEQQRASGGTRPGAGAAQRPPDVEGVSEADMLRVVVAFHLRHPTWQPKYLTHEVIDAVASALPAAAATVGNDSERAVSGSEGSTAAEPGRRNVAGKARDRTRQLLQQLKAALEQGEEEVDAPGQQQRRQAAAGETEVEGSGEAEQTEAEEGEGEAEQPADQLQPMQQEHEEPAHAAATAATASQQGGSELQACEQEQRPPVGDPLLSQPASQREGQQRQAQRRQPLPRQQLGHGEPMARQPQRLGAAGTSAFRPLAGTSSQQAQQQAQQQQQQQHRQPLSEQQVLQGLLQQLGQLPVDVQAVFHAGLAAGLPPEAAQAALRRFLRITTTTCTGQQSAVAQQVAADGGSPAVEEAHEDSSGSSTDSEGGGQRSRGTRRQRSPPWQPEDEDEEEEDDDKEEELRPSAAKRRRG